MDLKEARTLYIRSKGSLGCMCRDLDEKKRKEFYDLNITEGTLKTWKYEHLLKTIEQIKNVKSLSVVDALFRDLLFYLETYSDFQKVIDVALELKLKNDCFINDAYLLKFIFNTKTISPNTKLLDDMDFYIYACEIKDLECLQILNHLLSIISNKNQNLVREYLSLYMSAMKKYNITLNMKLESIISF